MPENDPLSVQRGDYGRNLLPTLLFVLGRVLSGPMQYFIITAHPLSYLGVPPPPTGGLVTVFGYEVQQFPLIISSLTVLLSSKHIFWQLYLCHERMTMQFAYFAIIADGVYESISSLVFTAASLNPFFSERFLYIGSAIFVTSVGIELTSELQRHAFKSNPRNKGKLYTSGLWRVTRHINYTANVFFGFGFGLATGGPVYTILTAGMYLSNFTFNAIPSIESYCAEKYGKAWEKYKKDVPWSLIPGLY